MIKLIEVEKLKPHPKNPRKHLGSPIGSLGELIESVKQNGIMQNLTAVKNDDNTYTVIIGHRRLAAAKKAGIEKVPVAIVEMTEREQLATMLLENMQRKDLTVYEEALGFQMMIDVGDDIKTISQQTGLSESTVRRRTKLLELDQEKFEASVSRGATLKDFIELDKIEDIDKRNEVLEAVGTNNFQHRLVSALKEQQEEKDKQRLIEKLSTFAIEIESTKDLNIEYINWYRFKDIDELKTPDDAKTRQYYYRVEHYYIDLFADKVTSDKNDEIEEEKRAEEAAKRTARLEMANAEKRARLLRQNFVLSVSPKKAKQHIADIVKLLLVASDQSYFSINTEDIIKVLEVDEVGDEKFNKIVEKTPELALLKLVYNECDAEYTRGYVENNLNYRENRKFDAMYELLEALGYQISDEEIELKEGTHQYYKKE